MFSYSMVNDQSAVNTEAGKKGLAHLKLFQHRQSKCFQEESQLLVIVNTPEIISVTASLFRKTGAAAAQNVACMFDVLLSYMFSRCRPRVCAHVCLSTAPSVCTISHLLQTSGMDLNFSTQRSEAKDQGKSDKKQN